jgi:hypothetical protein
MRWVISTSTDALSTPRPERQVCGFVRVTLRLCRGMRILGRLGDHGLLDEIIVVTILIFIVILPLIRLAVAVLSRLVCPASL